MGKEALWLKHDYNARGDTDMVPLRRREGMAGVGIYWCIVEMLYEQGGYLTVASLDNIAYDLRAKAEQVKRIVMEYDLFESDDVRFWSARALRGLADKKERTSKARESAKERWKKDKPDANALPLDSEGNAKERERRGEEKDESRVEGERSLAWFKGLFDEKYLTDLKLIHEGKSIDQAINEAYGHVSASPRRLRALDVSEAKRVLNSWLSHTPTRVNSNGKGSATHHSRRPEPEPGKAFGKL